MVTRSGGGSNAAERERERERGGGGGGGMEICNNDRGVIAKGKGSISGVA